jgi:hypothetical protein
MPEQLERAQRYRKRAEELRTTTDYRMRYKNRNKVTTATLIVLARQYENFAEQLERAANAGGLSPA